MRFFSLWAAARLALVLTVFCAGLEGTGLAAQPLQVILLDVHGLWGGRDLWIAADGEAVCRIAAAGKKERSGLQERRYRFVLDSAQRERLAASLIRHRFFSIRTRTRQGVPDEARPVVFVHWGPQTRAVAKWVGDPHPDFDALYQDLLKIASAGEKGRRIYEGPLERSWRPEGFPDSEDIRRMAQPE